MPSAGDHTGHITFDAQHSDILIIAYKRDVYDDKWSHISRLVTIDDVRRLHKECEKAIKNAGLKDGAYTAGRIYADNTDHHCSECSKQVKTSECKDFWYVIDDELYCFHCGMSRIMKKEREFARKEKNDC